MNDVAILFNGAHPVHKKFGESVDAVPFHITDRVTKQQNALYKGFKLIKNVFSLPENFDFMLTESCYYYPAFKRRLGGMRKTKIINISCGPLFYHVITGRVGKMEKKVLMELEKEIDGHIVLGKYGEELVRKIDKETQLRIAYPFIISENYKRFSSVKPDLNSKNLAIIATNDYVCKGLDIAIEAVKIAWMEDKEIRLNIIGNINKKTINKLSEGHPAIKHLGFISNLPEVLSKNSLYIHPARGDTFPVSILEAMAAGVPTLVSEETGTKEAVEKADKNFIKKAGAEEFSAFILNYLSKSESEKELLSKKFRKESEEYTEEKKLPVFRKQFLSLASELDQ